MPKFRKKPVVIEAEQWFPGKTVEDVESKTYKSSYSGRTKDVTEYFVRTLEGPLRVSPGDWVITGVKGEKYPCKPDIFEATYEEIEEEEPWTKA